MKRLVNYFLQGLIVLAPMAVTLYVCVRIFRGIDAWLGIPIPGAGFLLTILLITATGFLASNLITRSLVATVERVMNRLPFVRLLYSATKDLLNAFVGEKRRFDKPVLVALSPGASAKVLGFATQESMARFGLSEEMAVYVPQSYGLAGNLIVVPKSQVTPVRAESSEVMAFIVSGGVARVTG
ncbi:MAG: DUF502 domain-containing protein [Gemmatimonadota bacterium]|nr:DUF502 domain-containing protein [Gemmatimonadota bacterium]